MTWDYSGRSKIQKQSVNGVRHISSLDCLRRDITYLSPMETICGMTWLLKTLMGSSGVSSVKQVGLSTMVPTSNLNLPVHTTTQEQEERAMEEETIEDRLNILPSTALIRGKCTSCL